MTPSNVTSYAHKALLAFLPKYELNKGSTNRHANIDGERAVDLHLPLRTTNSQRTLRVGEMGLFPMEDHLSGFLNHHPQNDIPT